MPDALSDTYAVQQARQAGYTDQEIADHLAQSTPAVQQARQAGYTDSDIVNHLATPPQDNSAVRGFVLGLEKPIDKLADLAMHIPGAAAIDRAGQALGLPSEQRSSGLHDLARQGNTRTGYQTAGNVVGAGLTTARVPGGVLAQGGATGALLSDRKDLTGTATDAAIGAVTAGVGAGIMHGLGALARPVTNKAAVVLHNAGIDLSPGQLLQATGSKIGNAVRGLEDKARSIPIVGSFISGSRDRATNAVNQHLANDALATIGKKAPANLGAGYDLIDNVDGQLSARYQQIVPHLVGRLDQQFADDLADAKQVTHVLPADRQQQFEGIVRDVFGNRAQGGAITGQNLKDAESRLTLLAKKYSNSQDADQKILGESLFKVRQALRDMAVRSDPSGKDLQAVNQGWAKLKQMQAAANTKGVVLPGALVRQANRSGYGKDFARAAATILPDHVPNSGTADRYLMAKLLGGGGGASEMASLSGHPGIAAGVGGTTLAGLAASSLYTKAGQRFINKLAFAARPKAVQKAGTLAQYAAKLSPLLVPVVHK